MRTVAVAIAAALVVTALAPRGYAQGTDEKATAEVLFNDARHLMEEGHYAAACPKLVESQQIDPAIGTLGWIGQCYEKIGKTASAWATYREAASLAQQRGESERRRVAQERADALEPTLSRLTIDTGAVNGITEASILRNGKPVVRSLWGLPFPVDPGDHTIEVRAPGYKTETLQVHVAAGGAQHGLTILPLERAPAAVGVPAATSGGAPAAAPVVNGLQPVAAERPAPARGTSGTPAQAVVGYTVAGLGVVGLGVGVGFFLDAKSKRSARDDRCPAAATGGVCANPADQTEFDSLQSAAGKSETVALVSSIAGGAVLATGIVLLVTAPSRDTSSARRLRVAPVATRRGGGLWMEGTW